MFDYAALQSFVMYHYNHEVIRKALAENSFDQKIELYRRAMQTNNFLVLEALLQSDADIKNTLRALLNDPEIHTYSLDVLAILINYGVDVNQSVNETTLLSIIKSQDKDLAEFLESETKNLKSLMAVYGLHEHSHMSQSSTSKTEFIKFFMEFYIQAADSVKLCHIIDLFKGIMSWRRLNNQLDLVLSLIETSKMTCDVAIIGRIHEEINFVYSLYYAFPYYENHVNNFINRLKNCNQSIKAICGEEENLALIQGLAKIFADFDALSASTESSQSWIINPTAAIKETEDVPLENSAGQCFGFAFMIKQAMDSDDLASCMQRIEWMKTIPTDQLKEILRDNHKGVQAHQREGKAVTEMQWQYLELEAYLQAIAFAQRPMLIADFETATQDVVKISTVLRSKKLEDLGGLVRINHFTYYYDHASLLTYFQTLRELIHTNPPGCAYVSLFLSCPTHIITVGYDIQQRKWLFCDANAEPQIQPMDSNWLLAAKVLSALSIQNDNTICNIETGVYAAQNQEKSLNAIFAQWQIDPRIQAIQSRHRQQALQTSMSLMAKPYESAELAIISGNIALADFALKGVDINAPLHMGELPLALAIQYEKFDMVRYLIEQGADVNRSRVTAIRATESDPIEDPAELYYDPFHRPLHCALSNKNTDIFHLLLRSGVACSEEQMLYLMHAIITEQKIEHYKSLLENAQDEVKEILINNLSLSIYGIIKDLPMECRGDYLIGDEVKAYLPHWINDSIRLDHWLDLLPLDERTSFLQQLSSDHFLLWARDIYQLGNIVALLSKQGIALFFQGFIPQLLQTGIQTWITNGYELGEVSKLIPEEQIAPFLLYPTVQAHLATCKINLWQLDSILNILPPISRYPFIQNSSIRSLLIENDKDAFHSGTVISQLPEDCVLSFLQEYLDEDALEECVIFRLPTIVQALPKHEIISFMSKPIVIDNLRHYMRDRNRHIPDITHLIASFPPDLPDLLDNFLAQPVIQYNLTPWLSDPKNFCRMLIVLPFEKVGSLIQQRPIGPWDLYTLLEELNNKYPDILVECLVTGPEILEGLDNIEHLHYVLSQLSRQFDAHLFVKNLVCVIQRLEKTDEKILTRLKQYEDPKKMWLYDNLMSVYWQWKIDNPQTSEATNQEITQEGPASDLLQNSFFTERNTDLSVAVENHAKVLA